MKNLLILSGAVEIRSSANWLDGFREKLIASLLNMIDELVVHIIYCLQRA